MSVWSCGFSFHLMVVTFYLHPLALFFFLLLVLTFKSTWKNRDAWAANWASAWGHTGLRIKPHGARRDSLRQNSSLSFSLIELITAMQDWNQFLKVFFFFKVKRIQDKSVTFEVKNRIKSQKVSILFVAVWYSYQSRKTACCKRIVLMHR